LTDSQGDVAMRAYPGLNIKSAVPPGGRDLHTAHPFSCYNCIINFCEQFLSFSNMTSTPSTVPKETIETFEVMESHAGSKTQGYHRPNPSTVTENPYVRLNQCSFVSQSNAVFLKNRLGHSGSKLALP